jgi:hypothetical protein
MSSSGGKSYGKQFRDALPSTRYLRDVEAVAEFFGTEPDAPPSPAEPSAPLEPGDPDYDIPF